MGNLRGHLMRTHGVRMCLWRMLDQLRKFWRRSGWNEFVWTSVVFAGVAALGVFVLLANVTPGGEYLALEEKIMRSLRRADDPARIIGPWWVQEAARDVSALGSAVALILMTLLVLGYLLMRRAYLWATLVTVATLGGYGLSAVMKTLFGRSRPDVVPHLSHVTSESFPSGHSMLASVVYLTLGALLAQAATRRREKIYFIQAAFFLSGIIGLSRVLLGVHYPSDVLGGWAAGTVWALVCWCVAWRLQRRTSVVT